VRGGAHKSFDGGACGSELSYIGCEMGTHGWVIVISNPPTGYVRSLIIYCTKQGVIQ
jgi:hypothetical protein